MPRARSPALRYTKAMIGPSDTDPQVARMQLERIRQMSPARRLQAMASMSETVIRLSRQALERQLGNHPSTRIEWIRLTHGADLAEGVRRASRD